MIADVVDYIQRILSLDQSPEDQVELIKSTFGEGEVPTVAIFLEKLRFDQTWQSLFLKLKSV